MATRTNPLVTAATLAGAAAIAVATPAIAPTLTLPTPHALSAAQVQLDTFADVLSVPAGEWSALLFGTTSWGGALGRTSYGAAIAAPQTEFGQNGYVNPWAYFCNSGCTRSGVTGAAYLFFDACDNQSHALAHTQLKLVLQLRIRQVSTLPCRHIRSFFVLNPA